jgi:hypothetical protein
VSVIDRRRVAGKLLPLPRTPAQVARRCLIESRGNPTKAATLARRYARGSRLRAAVAAIGTEVLAGLPGVRKGGRA